MELPEPIARNALRHLQYLSERERRPELGLPEIPEISEVVGLIHHETSDLIDILDDAVTAIKDMQVRGAPLIGDYRISLLEVTHALSALRPREC